MPVTAKDVARELNLSQPTVSRILNGDQAHRASDETRRRVWDAAKRLGYQPNAVARSLRRGRTDIIGVHTGPNYDVRNDFLGHIVGALQGACAPRGLDLMLHTGTPGDSAQGIFGKLRDGRIDGLVLHTCADDPLVGLLSSCPLPVVAVADPLPGLPNVTVDDAVGMRQLINLLWERGYRRFCFLAPDIYLASVERRREAFVQEMQRREIPTWARPVFKIRYEKTNPILPQLLQLAAEGGPVAVCCWNDRTAYSLLRTCAENGIEVPKTLAVAGFDGFLDDKLPARQLVTVCCPWDDVATTALEVLVDLIENRSTSQSPGQTVAIGDYPEIKLPATVLDGDTV